MRRVRQRRRRHHIDPGNLAAVTFKNRIIVYAVVGALCVLIAVQILGKRGEPIERKVARTREAMEQVAGALRRYHIDHKSYPIQSPRRFSSEGLLHLTTPHPYLFNGDVLRDPFSDDFYQLLFEGSEDTRFVLRSIGPDGTWQSADAVMNASEIRDYTTVHRYAPTQGALSPGDILWIEPGP